MTMSLSGARPILTRDPDLRRYRRPPGVSSTRWKVDVRVATPAGRYVAPLVPTVPAAGGDELMRGHGAASCGTCPPRTTSPKEGGGTTLLTSAPPARTRALRASR